MPVMVRVVDTGFATRGSHSRADQRGDSPTSSVTPGWASVTIATR
jgi:hypothetical protein